VAYELVEEPLNDARNARALAAASQIAYYDADRGVEAFQNELGMTAKLISVSNTQVYVASNDAHLLIAFRGSQGPTSIDGLKDWLLTNALNLLIVPEGPLGADFISAGTGARFHQGFVSAISEVWEPLFAEVDAELKRRDRPFWITGHSLGGALALLGSWLFLRKTIPVTAVYTYGAPMVGNNVVAEAFNREYAGKIFRYVNAADPVPLLPMMSLIANDFSHCETGVPLGDGSAADSALAMMQDLASQIGQAVFSGYIMDSVWKALKGRVDAHLLTDYRKLLG
jgi:triacylglycerol lipase